MCERFQVVSSNFQSSWHTSWLREVSCSVENQHQSWLTGQLTSSTRVVRRRSVKFWRKVKLPANPLTERPRCLPTFEHFPFFTHVLCMYVCRTETGKLPKGRSRQTLCDLRGSNLCTTFFQYYKFTVEQITHVSLFSRYQKYYIHVYNERNLNKSSGLCLGGVVCIIYRVLYVSGNVPVIVWDI